MDEEFNTAGLAQEVADCGYAPVVNSVGRNVAPAGLPYCVDHDESHGTGPVARALADSKGTEGEEE